ncbi:MAG: hypothetical protein JNK82_27995 [Myxococcaceae bacterium]|nr:hypothetical protein [Myxococcaceae bacterium]
MRTRLTMLLVVMACSGSMMPGGTGGGTGNTSGGSGGSGGTAGGGMQMTVDCLTPCVARASSCGAPAAQAQQVCAGLCASDPTEAQIDCLETSSCQALSQPNPCGLGGAAGGGGSAGGGSGSAGGSGAAGGRAGGSGAAGGGMNPLSCAGATCKSSGACCTQYPYCSPNASACTVQCKANAADCFFDSDCCSQACNRSTNKCVTCKGSGAACGGGNNDVACCSGSCANNQCASCAGPGEICVVNADCCGNQYCNSGKCFARLRDGGIP